MTRIALTLFIGFFALSSRSGAAASERLERVRILTFEQVKSLPMKTRNEYIKALGRTLTELEQIQPHKYSFIEQLLSFGSIAYASEVLYQCIGGGVPEARNPEKSTCGVNEYAGFKCTGANEKICNPLVFGVSSSGKPTCHVNATTQWCFNNTKLGVTNFIEPVFRNPKNEGQWGTMMGHLHQACNEPSSIAESQDLVNEACSYVRVQMRYNEEVKKITTSEYSYKKDGQYLGQEIDVSGRPQEHIAVAGPLQLPTDAEWRAYRHSDARSSYVPRSSRASIQGVEGQLWSPLPGCKLERDHYEQRAYGFHPAEDLVHKSMGSGAPVKSVAPGVVVFRDSDRGTGYGNRVIVMHKTEAGEIFYTSYNHLQSIPNSIQVGTKVGTETTLGGVGTTGHTTGPHLHFEIFDKNKMRSDPKNYYANKDMCGSPPTPVVSVRATPPPPPSRTTAAQ